MIVTARIAPAAGRWRRSDDDVSRYHAVTPATDVPGSARMRRTRSFAPPDIGRAMGVTSAAQSPPPSVRGVVIAATPRSSTHAGQGPNESRTTCSGARA